MSAIASMSVDLPEPFSPTINVTSGWNLSDPKFLNAGMEKGYTPLSAIFSVLSTISFKNGFASIVV